MALPASDDFAGTGALSGNWTANAGSASRVSGVWQGGAVTENIAYWSGDAFGNDQEAQAVVDGGASTGVAVRINGSKQYILIYNNASDGIYTLDGTSYNRIQNLTALGAGTYTIKLKVVGDTLQAFVGGVQVGTDQAGGGFVASGAPGIYSYGPTAFADDFLADVIGGGAWGALLGMQNNRLVRG